jgi:lysyl endopeptidase
MGNHGFSSATDFDLNVVLSGDANNSNNASNGSVALATAATSLLYVHIMTDEYGYETSWEITNGNGDVMASVGTDTYGDQTEYEQYVSVPTGGCYTFTLNDEWGDGLFGSQWNGTDGFCNVASVNEDLTFSSFIYSNNGSYNFESEAAAADVTTVLNVSDMNAETTFAVYPNPVSDVAYLDLNVAAASNVNVNVFNLIGQQVMTQNLGNIPAGQQRVELNFSALQAGVYLVSIDAGTKTSTLRVTVK